MEASSGTLAKGEGTYGFGEGAIGREGTSGKDGVRLGAGSGSRLSKVSGTMGPEVVPEGPKRLENEKVAGKKFMNEGTKDQD